MKNQNNLEFYNEYIHHINKIVEDLYGEIKNNEYKNLSELDQAIWDSVEDNYCKPKEVQNILLSLLKQEYADEEFFKGALIELETGREDIIEYLSFELISNILFNRLKKEYHIKDFGELFERQDKKSI